MLLAASDQIAEKALIKDTRRKFWISCARETLKVNMQTTYESAEKIATVIEGKLDDMKTQSWSVVQPRIKSISGSPKGKRGKDGKGDGKGKKGKG